VLLDLFPEKKEGTRKERKKMQQDQLKKVVSFSMIAPFVCRICYGAVR